MDSALNKLREGCLSFDAFARETRSDWERLGNKMLARWKVPPHVDIDDIVQEMLVEAWEAVAAYDGRGKLKTYVVWRAMTVAKRWLRIECGYSKCNGKRDVLELQLVAVGDMIDEAGVVPSVEASQERIVQYLQRLHAAAKLLYTEQHRVRPNQVVELGGLEDMLELLISCGETPWSRVGKFLSQTAIQLEE